MLWRIMAAIGAAAALFFVVTPPGRHLAKGAVAEARILAHRRPIESLLRDSTIDAPTRAKLTLVQEARRYAVQSLGLRAKESFTTYTKLDSDTLVLVLTVAYRDRLAVRTWWWPVVGRVPYKGFFDFAAGRAEQDRYERDGFDTELRPSAAFSTLGWFNDPLLSTTLHADSTRLVDTVIHELLHNTVWIPGDVGFNESFASFVGRHGAANFFRDRGDSANMARLERNRPAERALGKFYEAVYASLDSAFKAHPGDPARDARITARDSVFAVARIHLRRDIGPAFGVTDTTWANRFRLNIATILARRVYRDEVDDFETVLASSGGDLRNAVARIGDAATAAPKDKAFAAIKALARGREDEKTRRRD
jgi:predicted aminopeptidase